MGLVPDWFQQKGTDTKASARVARIPWTLLAAGAVYFTYGWWLLPVLTDWVSFAVDEGFTAYGTDRLLRGEWPHRDFFFLWTDGILWMHALAKLLGVGWLGERGLSLSAATINVVLCLAWAKRLGLGRFSQGLLFLLSLTWGFTLWNIPYSSWYAVPLALGAAWALPKRICLAALLFACAFWMKQNVGLLSLAGAVGGLWICGEKAHSKKLAICAGAMILLPFLAFFFGGVGAFSAAFSQIILFPLQYRSLMALPLGVSQLAGPLMCLGLWIISLYLVHKKTELPLLRFVVQLSWVIYSAYRWSLEGAAFGGGMFFLLSLTGWLLIAPAILARNAKKSELVFFLLPAAGAFLQVYPRADFQHFLFVFPPAMLVLLLALEWIRETKQKARLWLHAPLIALLLAGLYAQARLHKAKQLGELDPYGRISFGDGLALNREMREVGEYLRGRGLVRGSPLLVLPNANYFYSLEEFRNPTPHNQFFPGYVEAFGERQQQVLSDFEKAGGRFLVMQKRSGTERNVPFVYEEIRQRYRLAKDFPVHFSVWEMIP